MNVSGVGGNTYSGATGMGNLQLKAIDKQIAELQKSIQKVKADKNIDAKSKSDKIKEYEDKITQLQQQKSQIQAEERKSRQAQEEREAKAVRRAEENSDAPVKDSTQKALIQADGAMKTDRNLGVIRADLEGKLRIAESKSYLREPDPVAAAEIRGKISFIDNQVIGKAKKATVIMKEAGKPDAAPGVQDDVEDENKASAGENIAPEADTEEQKRKGTGRFEAGQFLYEEA